MQEKLLEKTKPMHSLELTQWDQRRMPQEVEMSRELQQLMEKTRIAQKQHQMNANANSTGFIDLAQNLATS